MPGIMVTGASGLLGRPLVRELKAQPGWQVFGTAFSRAGGDLLRLDLRDARAVEDALDRLRPAILVHCAAERRPDVSARDAEGTRQLNVAVTAQLAVAAAARGIWMLLLSTDYVFDGLAPPYAEDAATHPLNDYGISKRDAELALWAATSDAGVLRVPILYGEINDYAESAVTAGIVPALLDPASRSVRCDAWATRFPTSTDDVAVTIRQMLAHRLHAADLRGTFHWSGNEPMTKYDMAVTMARILGRDPAILVADPRPPGGAVRPKNSQLACTRLERMGLGRRTPFAQAMARILAKH
ncbi:MAG: SDR family oxidoreductase [Kiritimatiellae bacterium]|nr:SDR family oxidoreductase [Kiritimatiellia bacterium]